MSDFSKWDYLFLTCVIIGIILLIIHLFTGKSWEAMVGILFFSELGIWREIFKLKTDIKFNDKELNTLKTDINTIKGDITDIKNKL